MNDPTDPTADRTPAPGDFPAGPAVTPSKPLPSKLAALLDELAPGAALLPPTRSPISVGGPAGPGKAPAAPKVTVEPAASPAASDPAKPPAPTATPAPTGPTPPPEPRWVKEAIHDLLRPNRKKTVVLSSAAALAAVALAVNALFTKKTATPADPTREVAAASPPAAAPQEPAPPNPASATAPAPNTSSFAPANPPPAGGSSAGSTVPPVELPLAPPVPPTVPGPSGPVAPPAAPVLLPLGFTPPVPVAANPPAPVPLPEPVQPVLPTRNPSGFGGVVPTPVAVGPERAHHPLLPVPLAEFVSLPAYELALSASVMKLTPSALLMLPSVEAPDGAKLAYQGSFAPGLAGRPPSGEFAGSGPAAPNVVQAGLSEPAPPAVPPVTVAGVGAGAGGLGALPIPAPGAPIVPGPSTPNPAALQDGKSPAVPGVPVLPPSGEAPRGSGSGVPNPVLAPPFGNPPKPTPEAAFPAPSKDLPVPTPASGGFNAGPATNGFAPVPPPALGGNGAGAVPPANTGGTAPAPAPAPLTAPAPGGLALPTPQPEPIGGPLTPAAPAARLKLDPADSTPAALSLTKPAGATAPAGEAARTDFDLDLHEAKAGDTYAAISKLHYGDAKYADALRTFNRNLDLGRAGASVEVPPMYVLRKRYPHLLGRTPAGEPAARTSESDWGRPTKE